MALRSRKAKTGTTRPVASSGNEPSVDWRPGPIISRILVRLEAILPAAGRAPVLILAPLYCVTRLWRLSRLNKGLTPTSHAVMLVGVAGVGSGDWLMRANCLGFWVRANAGWRVGLVVPLPGHDRISLSRLRQLPTCAGGGRGLYCGLLHRGHGVVCAKTRFSVE